MLHAVTTGAYHPPVDTTWKNFDYRSILVDSGSIVQCYNSKCVSYNHKLRVFSFLAKVPKLGEEIYSQEGCHPFENRIIFFFESKLRAITVRPNFPVSQCCGNLQFGKRRFSDSAVQHYIVALL